MSLTSMCSMPGPDTLAMVNGSKINYLVGRVHEHDRAAMYTVAVHRILYFCDSHQRPLRSV